MKSRQSSKNGGTRTCAIRRKSFLAVCRKPFRTRKPPEDRHEGEKRNQKEGLGGTDKSVNARSLLLH